MLGCLRRLGCLVLFMAILVAVAWWYRDRWLPLLPRHHAPTVAADTTTWELLTPAGAERARAAVQKMASKSGPVFVNVSPGDLSAYIFQELSKQLPSGAEDLAAAVIGDQLYIRGDFPLSELGGGRSLGPLTDVLGSEERVTFGGTFEIVRPGLAEYHVHSIRVRDLDLPGAMIPRLVRQVGRGSRPAGIAEDALPLVVPANIADVRLRAGKVTLYKSST